MPKKVAPTGRVRVRYGRAAISTSGQLSKNRDPSIVEPIALTRLQTRLHQLSLAQRSDAGDIVGAVFVN